MSDNASLYRWLSAFMICVVAVVFCAVYVDRPVADALRPFMWTTPWFWIRRLLTAASAIAALLVFCGIGCGIWVASGRHLQRWTEIPLLCSWSVTLSIAVETILKRVIGRLSPNPEYILGHVYGFRVLRGVVGQDAFPSGTASVAAALVAVFWLRVPQFRVPAIAVGSAVCIALVVTNTHWLGDVIGGAFIGAVIGVVTDLLRRPEAETLVSRRGSSSNGRS
jgi:undecaprenyl-diphosphatase